MFNIH